MDELGFGPLTGMAAALVAFTVSAIDALKTYVLKGWTSRIPAVVWYCLAIAIPTGVCIWLGLDWFNAITGEAIPENLTPYSSAATGIIVGIGASGSYKLKEAAKALKAESMKAEGKAVPEYLTPPGEPGIPAPESPIMPEPGEPATENSSVPATAPVVPPGPAIPLGAPVVAPVYPEEEPVLLLTTTDYRPEYVWVDGNLRAVTHPEPKYIAGPSERFPNHVFVPKDWNR
jgi:hypothetical protein